ncbi:hypothetical protein J9303_09360 [Bacillaceae bacterium Marseille-Q3522]|nr:hypothetical protein [Bacillaceae bacterium Marseille-Q3522]
MRKSGWNDEQVEKLLTQLPKIEDKRDPKMMYQRIKMQLQQTRSQKREKKWIIPGLATVAALFIFFLITNNLLINQNNASQENAASMEDSGDSVVQNRMAEEKAVTDFAGSPESASDNAEFNLSFDKAEDDPFVYTAVSSLPDNETEIFTYAIPDQNVQNVVPVTILVPNDDKLSSLDLYKAGMEKLPEEKWGLKDFYPLNATISSIDENVISVDVPEDQKYKDGTQYVQFIDALQVAFDSLHVDRIELSTNGVPGMDLGDNGIAYEMNKMESNTAYFLFYPVRDGGKPFLVPYKYGQGDTIQSKLESMKQNVDTHELLASIPEQLDFSVSEEGEQLTITFAKGTELEKNQDTIWMIEAILLTAKSFHYSNVKFENTGIEQVGKYKFTDVIKVPLAPNLETIK